MQLDWFALAIFFTSCVSSVIDRRELLIRAGEALFGPNWQTALAAEMDVTARYVRMLAVGDRPVTDAHLGRLLEIVREHAKKLEGVAAALEKGIEK